MICLDFIGELNKLKIRIIVLKIIKANVIVNTHQWGTYEVPGKLRLLRILIRLGMSRGSLRSKITRIWLKTGNIFDVELDGIRYRLDISNNFTDRKILLSSVKKDAQELQFLSQACKGKVFIDIGANIGYYSLQLAKSGAKQVLAFEPNPPTLNRLRYNVSINEFGKNISVFSIGIGEEGRFRLYSKGDLGTASMRKNQEIETSDITITTRPLFDILTEENICSIGGLKVDIEGMEDVALFPFFQKAPKSLWPDCIVIEHKNQGDWNKDIISYLNQTNYVIYRQIGGNTVLKKTT